MDLLLQWKLLKMKILFNRICNKISGAEIYNIYLLAGLKTYRDLHITFSSDNETLLEHVKKMGNQVEIIKPGINEIGTKKQFLLAIPQLPLFYLRYLNFFRKIGKQDLYVFESMNEKLFLTTPLVILKRKVIWIEHGPLFQTQRALIVKWLYRMNSRFVNKIICVSESTRKDLHVDNKKLATVYVGIDTTTFAPLEEKVLYRYKSRLHLQNSSIIGYLGTVSKEKGIQDFLDVATLITKEKNNIRFIVIGGGPLLEWAKEEIERKSLSSKFLFTGFIQDVREYLGILDILLFPSHHNEGLSISLLEAHAMGIPCVASNMGGNSEIILQGQSGYIYKNSSSNKIKELLIDVLKLKKKFKANARKVILDSFSLKENAEKFYLLFNEIYEY